MSGRLRWSRALLSAAVMLGLTTAGIAVTPAAAAATGPTLVFASWNVCKTQCLSPAPAWEVRRDRVARVINESNVDVVGLQEATNWPTATAKTQLEDIQRLVAAGGYAAPTFPNDANECRRPRDANGQLAGASPCENTSALLFKTATVSQASVPQGSSAGIVQLGSIAPGVDALSAVRSVAWAYLRGTNGSGPFLAISMHTFNSKDATAENSRIMVGQSLAAWVSAWNTAHGMSGTPAILMADLNSYAKRQPNGVQAVLTANGWQDAWNAPSRRNIQYSTINYNPVQVDGNGFPRTAYEFRKTKRNKLGEATRIDYVMSLGTGVQFIDYEVVIYLNADGTFKPEYQASDHQMVKATALFSNLATVAVPQAATIPDDVAAGDGSSAPSLPTASYALMLLTGLLAAGAAVHFLAHRRITRRAR